ncbi:MAG: AAA family ATPase [bacterium]|nr:AAA family ATPase [bacterium]
MAEQTKFPAGRSPHRVSADDLRWCCDPGIFPFRTTDDLETCPINTIGQDRAEEALRLGLAVRSDGYNIFAAGEVGSGRSTVVRRMLAGVPSSAAGLHDLVYVHNFQDPEKPRHLVFGAGQGKAFQLTVDELIEALGRELPKLFDSEDYRRHRTTLLESAAKNQKEQLKEFERRVQQEGFALVQVQLGPITRPQLVPVVAGNPVEMDQLESLVEQDQFKREDLEGLQEKLTGLRTEMESLGKSFRNTDREVRRQLAQFDRELAKPLVDEALAELRERFAAEGLEDYLEGLHEDLLVNLAAFREVAEPAAAEGAEAASHAETPTRMARYRVNVLVGHEENAGRPIIWETAPNYRNLFGTVERTRTREGDWDTDHTRIRAGSLLRANGGFLVLDALDVLVEPGVWAALKRTLRTQRAEVQLFDPMHLFAGLSLTPEPFTIDVKVVMIGTRHIYRLLYAMDEDFKKIFKIKAELSMSTPLSDQELQNYACFVYKKVQDDKLRPFHRDAVAAIVEHGVRLSGHHQKLTTRFTEIADLVRESGFWASQEEAKSVRVAHVDRALAKKRYRFDQIEELQLEHIAEGMVLLDLEGKKVGQINGLAVLDLGDHAFGQPSRITATTAMGRGGLIDIQREAEMAGPTHTKGVLTLSGFLRGTFAQDKPLTLTASLSFEQSYGMLDGDSASSAELYALLSSLSGVPITQGIAVTGSVNQKGEVQPIGGVNEKVEGFFELCRRQGLNGRQGVMIPTRNLPQLMLHKDVVAAVRKRKFHIWTVCTIQQGLKVLTGTDAGERRKDGSFPGKSVFGLADATLSRLAEQVGRFGPADARP